MTVHLFRNLLARNCKSSPCEKESYAPVKCASKQSSGLTATPIPGQKKPSLQLQHCIPVQERLRTEESNFLLVCSVVEGRVADLAEEEWVVCESLVLVHHPPVERSSDTTDQAAKCCSTRTCRAVGEESPNLWMYCANQAICGRPHVAHHTWLEFPPSLVHGFQASFKWHTQKLCHLKSHTWLSLAQFSHWHSW